MAFSKFDPIWSNIIQYGLVWSNMIHCNPIWSKMKQICNFLTKGLTTTKLCLGLREQSSQSKIQQVFFWQAKWNFYSWDKRQVPKYFTKTSEGAYWIPTYFYFLNFRRQWVWSQQKELHKVCWCLWMSRSSSN